MGSQFLYPRVAHLKSAAIDFAGSGNNTIVAAVASNRILIHRIWFVVGGATNLIFKDGTTGLSGTVPLSANGGITLDTTGEPWFITTIGNALIINSSAAVQIGGMVFYTLST